MDRPRYRRRVGGGQRHARPPTRGAVSRAPLWAGVAGTHGPTSGPCWYTRAMLCTGSLAMACAHARARGPVWRRGKFKVYNMRARWAVGLTLAFAAATAAAPSPYSRYLFPNTAGLDIFSTNKFGLFVHWYVCALAGPRKLPSLLRWCMIPQCSGTAAPSHPCFVHP